MYANITKISFGFRAASCLKSRVVMVFAIALYWYHYLNNGRSVVVVLKISLLRENRSEGQRQKKNAQADSLLSIEPDAGLNSRTPRSWPEPKSRVENLTNWAIQAPLVSFLYYSFVPLWISLKITVFFFFSFFVIKDNTTLQDLEIVTQQKGILYSLFDWLILYHGSWVFYNYWSNMLLGKLTMLPWRTCT